ncbi:MAG TPA: hypothetical protein VF610_04400 [Segetibacter sp.]
MSQYGYLGITFLANSSAQYNCHSYAWHLREGNSNRVWINNASAPVGNCNPETHNIDRYWTDGCFIRVCNEADADKVHYYCGDHSAVKSTTNPGYYESKWGNLPVLRHTRTGVPYAEPANSVNYYASTKISGSTSNLCTGTATYTVKNISGASYTWTFSSTLSVVGATNTNQITVQRNGSATGAAWVEVQISTPCSGTSATRRVDFSVSSPALQGYYVAQTGSTTSSAALSSQLVSLSAPQNQSVQFSIQLTSPNLSNVSWNLYGVGTITSSGSAFLNWTTPASGSSPNNVTVILNAVGACGSVSGTYQYRVVGVTGYMYSMSASPNPATTNINVQITEVEDTSSSTTRSPDMTASTTNTLSGANQVNKGTAANISGGDTKMYLYDFYTNTLIKQWKYLETKSSKYNLNIGGIKSGMYVLKMERNNKSATTKIVIQ